VRAAEVHGVEFPKLLDPVDDLPPATIITAVQRTGGKLLVRGVTQDNGDVAAVTVNGHPARITLDHAGVADWEAEVEASDTTELTATATDRAGNLERTAAKAMGSWR